MLHKEVYCSVKFPGFLVAGRKTYYTAYRVDKILGDTIFVNPINEVLAVPYSVMSEDAYSLLKRMAEML